MDNHRSHRTSAVLFLSMVVIVLCTYSYPALKTSATTGSHILPPISAPDLSLYLNISTIKTASTGELIDPYYGVTIPTARMGYLKFRLAFLLFGHLNSLLHGDLWWTLFLWNLFWWALLCAAALWLFQEFLPDTSPLVVVAGLAFLTFFNFGVLQSQVAAWIHLPSLHGFESVELPYIRPFFPQASVPLLLLYLGLQMKALQRRRWWIWAAMAATQFLAFAIFPYAMLMMVGITAVAVVGLFVSKPALVPRFTVLLYACACGIADVLFFLHGNQVARTGAPGHYSLIRVQLSELPHHIGGIWLILAVLTVSVLFLRDLAPEIRWPLAGLGLSLLLLLVGDAFVSETALQVSTHAGYFVHLTAAILLVFLAASGLRRWAKNTPSWRIAVAAVTALLVVNGMLIAYATYLGSFPINKEQADVVRLLQSDPPQANDLVIARSLFVEDDCAWVPLVSTSHPLYCRNAQVLLSPEQNQQVQRFRQALYLYFTNLDSRWVEHVLEDPKALTELSRLTFLGQVTVNPADRQQGIDAVRNELTPLLIKVENKDPEVQSFFSRYRRILVVDTVANPYFASSRLSAYLNIEKQETIGNLHVYHCHPLP